MYVWNNCVQPAWLSLRGRVGAMNNQPMADEALRLVRKKVWFVCG